MGGDDGGPPFDNYSGYPLVLFKRISGKHTQGGEGLGGAATLASSHSLGSLAHTVI